jgi:hypothetical protein
LLVPKDAKISSTASVDGNGQFHYERAWASHTLTAGKDYDELSFEVEYPDFQAEIYYLPVSSKAQRNFNFKLKTPVAVENLGVEIEEPLRATSFKVKPTGYEKSNDGTFNYYLYNYGKQEAGREFLFQISYLKADVQPSLNQLGTENTPVANQRYKAVIWLLLAVALVVAGVSGATFRLKTTKVNTASFCPRCGSRLKKNSRFCAYCGVKIS